MAVYRGKTLITSGQPSHDGREIKGVFYMTASKYAEKLLEEVAPDAAIPPGEVMPPEFVAIGIRNDCFYYVIEEADLLDLVTANWDEIVTLLLNEGTTPADAGAVTFNTTTGKLDVSATTLAATIAAAITANAPGVIMTVGANPKNGGAVTYNTATGKLTIEQNA